MKEHSHCTPGLCPGATENGAMVSISVHHRYPLLQLQRALPWAALCEGMIRRWAAAGQKQLVALAYPGTCRCMSPWWSSWGVKRLPTHARWKRLGPRMWWHAYALVDRAKPRPQRRDHSNMARAYAALGQAGVDEITALLLHVAKDLGFADVRILSSNTAEPELSIGYPNEPGIYEVADQRCGHALVQLQMRGMWGVDHALAQVPNEPAGRSKNTPCLLRAHRQSGRG